MAITFQKLVRGGLLPDSGRNIAYLKSDNWDDYGYKTLFSLTVFDELENVHSIGNIKIGFLGQIDGWTFEQMPMQFSVLPDNFFSLGQDADYYINIVEHLSHEVAVNVLTALGDLAHDDDRLQLALNERSFNVSLTRSVNLASIGHQFRRILRGEAPLTNYEFYYEKAGNENYSGIKLEFTIKPNTKPASNIHIIISRNGVGKTTLLNNMVNTLVSRELQAEDPGFFATSSMFNDAVRLRENYFAGVVSVSFSAFDPFTPPNDQSNASGGMRYHYVGLTKRDVGQDEVVGGLKSRSDLCLDFINSLETCLSLDAKRNRWIRAVQRLESDPNFEEMDLRDLADLYGNNLSDDKILFSQTAKERFLRMSSGHAVVLLTITKLVETVEEKTLVLLDEPESHLHPPLLSAFIRALSDLLVDRNGVAIVATHSPVILQEVPKSCVSILRRNGLVSHVDRPESETFGENVGVLTREVFGLEVSKSGFRELLERSVAEGKSYEEVAQEYRHQIGFEAKLILRALIAIRDSDAGEAE